MSSIVDLPMEHKIKLREKLLIELLEFRNSNGDIWVKSLVNTQCLKYGIPIESRITDDVISEGVYNLLKMNIDKLLSSYEVSFKKILGLFKTIIIRKGFSKHSSGNPKHSVAEHLLFASNYRNVLTDDTNECVMEKLESNPEKTDTRLDVIREYLSIEDNHLLDLYIDVRFTAQGSKVYQNRPKIPKEVYSGLEDRIRQVVIDNNIRL